MEIDEIKKESKTKNFILFYFLILSWLKITITICEESTVTFLENYC
jgi:hypothetical protein